MKNLVDRVSGMVSDAKDAVLESLDNSMRLGELTDMFSKAGDAAKERSEKYTSDLIALSPTIEQIGFKTKSINLGIGLNPTVSFNFEKFKETNADTRLRILDEHKDKMLLGTIVKALISADNYTIAITVGLAPSIAIQLLPQ
jgi:hypothetical protein